MNKASRTALFLALCLCLCAAPRARAASYDEAMNKLVGWGVINGYANGQLSPERALTRAEFVAMVNRAYGYSETEDKLPFDDVAASSWYYDDINIGYTTGYFGGTGPKTASPNSALTREQTLTLLGRNMRMQPIPGEVTEFADGHDFSAWSRGYARAAYQRGILDSYDDATFRPRRNITRGEMAEILQRSLGVLIRTPGTHTLSDVYGNVTINTPGVTLKDTTVAGDLYITGGLDRGDVTLENVRVLGEIIVAGGAESSGGSESVVLRNVQADSLTVDSISNRYVSLRAEGSTNIDYAILRSDAYVQDRTASGRGFKSIYLDSPDDKASFSLSGNLESVVNYTPNSELVIGSGTAQTLSVGSAAQGTRLNIGAGATVKTLNLDAPTAVTGGGDVSVLNANASGSTVAMLPDTVSVRPGSTATVKGTVMDTLQGQEASLSPRLQAGYPRVTNPGATTATGVFSTNKAGTVYWAVSTGGSFTASELVAAGKDNARIITSGKTAVSAADKETNAAISKLSAGVSYRLFAVLQDAHGALSPVKDVSFKTVDNVAPSFVSPYPKLSQTTATSAHVQVMASKTCRLYYALCAKGAKAPTAAQLKAGSVSGAVNSGSMSVSRSVAEDLFLNSLRSSTEYSLFLCLVDNEGDRSSKVSTVAIKTPDNIAPYFTVQPYVVYEGETSLTLSATIDEDGTIYWAAVPQNSDDTWPDYPTDLNSTNSKTSAASQQEFYRRQITANNRTDPAGAVNAVRGSVSAKANTAVDLVIGGRNGALAPGTQYRIYYLAGDKANNYTAVGKSTYIPVKTAGSAPAALQSAAQTQSPARTPADTVVPTPAAVPTPEPVPVPQPAVKLSEEKLSLERGEKKTLTADVTDLEGDYTVSWIADSPDVHVSLGGEVTAIAPGEATVTAQVKQGDETVLSAACAVTVEE